DRELERLYRQLGDRRRIDIFYLNACKKLFSLAEPLREEQRPAFRLFTTLRIMVHAEGRLAERQVRPDDPSWLRMVQDLGQLFKEQAAQASCARAGRTTSIATDGIGQMLLAQAQAALPPADRPVLEWGSIHRQLWSLLFVDGQWRREETNRLQQRIATTDDPDMQ